jgi:ribosome-associated heat shock protein Hsp15
MPPMTSAEHNADARETPLRVRFDKWLWAARFYKTRSLAAHAIEPGQARLGGGRVKPAHVVRVGDSVSIRRRGIVVEVVVIALSDRRGSAADAARLYRETDASRRRTRARGIVAAPGHRHATAVCRPADQARAAQARGFPQ